MKMLNTKGKRVSAIILAAVTLAVCLGSCRFGGQNENYSSPQLIISNNELAPVSMTSYTKSDYSVFVKEDGYMPAKLEPDNGCYLGAYVLANRQIDFDMKKFDSLTGKSHALAVYNMKLGDEFPYNWVLECVANMKTPYIVMRPPNEYSVFQENLLRPAANGFAEIPVPFFVDFYPNPQSYTKNPQAYKDFYAKAFTVFKEVAPNTVFVISADSKNVYDFALYYPGDEYVDWVGIAISQPLYVNGSVNLRNYMKDLDYFYAMYQRAKPIIVSRLAFSSYSTYDHRYASREAAKKLNDFYTLLKSEYTRIKAVNYMDFNNIEGAPGNAERDNFSITQNDAMLEMYKYLIADKYFLSETSAEKKEAITETYKSFFPLYEDENFKYLSESVFSVELATPPPAGETESVGINGGRYYSSGTLQKSKQAAIAVDNELKQIILENIVEN